MFSKLKNLANLKNLAKFRNKSPKVLDLSSIKGKMTEGLFDVMENSFKSRQENTINTNYSPADVDKIIKGYARQNMILAAASSVVPGPFGVLGSIPELMLNFKNQMGMIYDLSCAHGKENFINKDVLLDIPFAAFGGNTNLMQLQGVKGELQNSPKDLLIGKATQLGESVIEKTLKKSIVQFIPVGGPILMAAWAKMTTSKISNISTSFLDAKEVYKEHFKPEETEAINKELQIQKIKGLANLIECNNEINEEQIAFIGPIIANSAIEDADKKHLLEEAMKNGSNFELKYDLLKEYEEAENLILELVIMAKRSGSIDNYEKEYIYKVANSLGIQEAFVADLLE